MNTLTHLKQTLSLSIAAALVIIAQGAQATLQTGDLLTGPMLHSMIGPAPNIMLTLDNFNDAAEKEVAWDKNFPAEGTLVAYQNVHYLTPYQVRGAGVSVRNKNVMAFADNTLTRAARSHYTNPLFYNPEWTYTPWHTGPLTQLPSYPATAAPLDPLQPSITVNLTQSRTHDPATWGLGTVPVGFAWRNFFNNSAAPFGNSTTFRLTQYYRYQGTPNTTLPYQPTTFAMGDFVQADATANFSPAHGLRTDCADYTACTAAEELQNFSNWFTYYRTNLYTQKAAASYVVAKLSDHFRVGLANTAANSVNVDGVANASVLRGVRALTPTQRSSLLSAIHILGVDATAVRKIRSSAINVGQYFSRGDTTGPWAETPGTGGTKSSCRASHNVLFSDGFEGMNAPTPSNLTPAMLNADAVTTPTVTINRRVNAPGSFGLYNSIMSSRSTQLAPVYPLKTNATGTLGDINHYFYWQDLVPALDNANPQGTTSAIFFDQAITTHPMNSANAHRGDVHDAQRLRFHALHLGTVGVMPSHGVLQSEYLYNLPNYGGGAVANFPDLVAPYYWQARIGTSNQCLPANDSTVGPLCKQTPSRFTTDQEQSDAMLHAALTGRGSYVEWHSVHRPGKLPPQQVLLNSILSELPRFSNNLPSSQTSGSVFEFFDTQGDAFTNVFQTRFSVDPPINSNAAPAWKSQLTVTTLSAAGFPLAGDGSLSTYGFTHHFSAYNFTYAVPNTRKVYTAEFSNTPSSLPLDIAEAETTGQTVDFAAQANNMAWLGGDMRVQDRVFRQKELRAIINSGVLAIKTQDFGYGFAATSADPTAYRTHLALKKAADGSVVVGDNSGHFRVINARTGMEKFVYIPAGVYADLAPQNAVTSDIAIKGVHSSDPDIGFRLTVDGPSSTADVYNGSAWRSIVITSLGNGGKGLFAVDPDVLGNGAGNATAANILWDKSVINAWGADRSDIGHIITRTSVVQTQDTTQPFVALVPNGAKSANESTVLFVLDPLTGAVVKKLTASASGGGLMGVTPLFNKKRQLIGAYGTDLSGKLWKFDFSGGSITNAAVGNSGAPLLDVNSGVAAAQQQSFSTRPVLAVHPKGGVIVMAGTGSAFRHNDSGKQVPNAMYGVHDPAIASAQPTITRSQLVSRTLAAAADTVNSTQAQLGGQTSQSNFGTVTATSTRTLGTYTALDWAVNKGWMVNLPASSTKYRTTESVINDPSMVNERLIFASATPAGSVSRTQDCDLFDALSSYVTSINPVTGGYFDTAVYDTNGDGRVDGLDNKQVVGYATVLTTGNSTSGTINVSGESQFSMHMAGVLPAIYNAGNAQGLIREGTITSRNRLQPMRAWRQIFRK